MEHSLIQLNDLPDEILMIILKKLYNVEVLYTLIGINKRLNAFVHDSIFTNYLTLMKFFSYSSIRPLSNPILNRFCLVILPEIHHKIKWLNVESSTMERILLATSYPNLYGLGLYNIPAERVKHILTGNTVLSVLFKNQILSLIVHISKNEKQISSDDVNKLIFTDIFTTFTNLQSLNFHPFPTCYQELSFKNSPPTLYSSTLLELYVNVTYFTDCLYLLDGRFNQLHTLYVKISWIWPSSLTIDNMENLPHLKCFSLYCDTYTNVYDELIVPLLHRMLNLEKIGLYLIVCGKNTFIDGHDLKKNILNHMPRLKKFIFNIRSTICLRNQINLPSIEDIQHTFKDCPNNQIISCVDYFLESELGQCHIYSYPYVLKVYHYITNNFPGGYFKHVREVSLFDERPFEHEFFVRIAQSFPFMKKLTVNNEKPQNDKRFKISENDNQLLSIIKYPYLIELDLVEAHDDYIEQFLLHTKTCLPNNVHLSVDYTVLKRVTQTFTRNTTRINCTKLKSLDLNGKYRIPKRIKQYFPHTKIK
ncbi:unnamed protein product [Rotaria sp. Silwood1]|nr:unnamed protein product [Rotaria sp. Silwood1]CAF0743276.1 unnamed protein product [Rotaria sp. Silwood1]CAF3346720.1 unnamed protein product [Rotaria sp. Silwood1]CAF4519810.1 unnamed protein product [Rotaria sp. Silwood1]